MYITSDNIIAFPTSRRLGKAQESRLLSEKALTRIVNTLIDVDSFSITADETISSTSSLEFNIHGFYFQIESANELLNAFESDTDVYAFIRVDSDTGELLGFDDDNNGQETSSYNGVLFQNSSSQPTRAGSNYYGLHLLHRDTVVSDWGISPDGKEKFSPESFQVDGGVIV